MTSDKAYKTLSKADDLKCELIVRDRPFERTITMQKDSSGHVGFQVKYQTYPLYLLDLF